MKVVITTTSGTTIESTTESCHNANFAIIIDDGKVGIMTTFSFQWLKERERLSLSAFLGTEDIGVHI